MELYDEKTMVCFAVIVILIFQVVVSFAGSPKVIYSAKVTDNKGVELLVTEFMGSNGNVFLFNKGDANLTVEFNKIKGIEVIGEVGKPLRGFVLAEVEFVSGLKDKLYWNIRGRHGAYSLRGISPTYGSKMRISYEDVKKIAFMHNGTYKLKSTPQSLALFLSLVIASECKSLAFSFDG